MVSLARRNPLYGRLCFAITVAGVAFAEPTPLDLGATVELRITPAHR